MDVLVLDDIKLTLRVIRCNFEDEFMFFYHSSWIPNKFRLCLSRNVRISQIKSDGTIDRFIGSWDPAEYLVTDLRKYLKKALNKNSFISLEGIVYKVEYISGNFIMEVV